MRVDEVPEIDRKLSQMESQRLPRTLEIRHDDMMTIHDSDSMW